MKVVQKDSKKIVKSVFNELMLLKEIDHPNVVKVYEYY